MGCVVRFGTILYNLKNIKSTHGGVLKLTLLHGCFSYFLNCPNGTKSRNAPHISPPLTPELFYMLKIEAQMPALKSHVKCELSTLANQTKTMSLNL